LHNTDYVPLHNPIGFGPLDFAELALAALLVALALAWRPFLAPFAARFARRTLWCMIALAALPVILRLLLLPHHPVPTPDIYDEFGHLLVADTLRHWRLANPPHPMHRFFETFFVLQRPTYSSIYPIGSGMMLALGWTIFGLPWAGVLLSTGLFCALCFWMLRGWTTPGWALMGGLLAVFEFGPLNQWTNNYWGGAFSAAAGCLVYGALPRLRNNRGLRYGVVLGLGLGMHLLSRPYESIFLLLSVLLFFGRDMGNRSAQAAERGAKQFRNSSAAAARSESVVRVFPGRLLRSLAVAGLVVMPAIGITLLQNKRVTGEWTMLPYALSQYQYGVPASLTFQENPTPHVALTPEQELDYRMQRGFHPGRDTFGSYVDRLAFRVRYYRFYFYAPLYIALLAFLIGIRTRHGLWCRGLWIPVTCVMFALGTNFFPAFQFHYLAAIVCLFVLMSVRGLQQLSRFRTGHAAARFVIFLCIAQFVFWYALHVPDNQEFAMEARRFDMWDSVNHGNPERRIEINRQIAGMPGKLLVFVRYWPQHVFQDEWVYNGADIDGQRVVWARDLGDAENQKLERYYGNRTALLLEPDFRPPRLTAYVPETPVVPPVAPEMKKEPETKKKPMIELEQVK
jgi:hypothetical protein